MSREFTVKALMCDDNGFLITGNWGDWLSFFYLFKECWGISVIIEAAVIRLLCNCRFSSFIIHSQKYQQIYMASIEASRVRSECILKMITSISMSLQRTVSSVTRVTSRISSRSTTTMHTCCWATGTWRPRRSRKIPTSTEATRFVLVTWRRTRWNTELPENGGTHLDVL